MYTPNNTLIHCLDMSIHTNAVSHSIVKREVTVTSSMQLDKWPSINPRWPKPDVTDARAQRTDDGRDHYRSRVFLLFWREAVGCTDFLNVVS